jgi:hypothetical protein
MAENSYDTAYKSDANGSYLVVTLKEEQPVTGYQVEMILNNKIKGVIPFNIAHKDDAASLCYNITSLTGFPDVIKNRRLLPEELLQILTGICTVLLECRGFLLDECCFLLHGEYIYINPSSHEVNLVYIPVKKSIDVNRALKELVSWIIHESSRFHGCEAGECMEKIQEFLHLAGFTASSFRRFLNTFAANSAAVPPKKHILRQDAGISDNSLSKKPRSSIQHFLKRMLKRIPHSSSKTIDTDPKQAKGFIVDTAARADTEVLVQEDTSDACLVDINSDRNKRFRLSSDNFLIGRLSEKVDYAVDNMAVGKIHACIKKRLGRYYIVDLNSKNGTYVNGIRLKSNVEHELSDNDDLILANTVLTFLYPS